MMTPPHSTLEPVTDVFHGVPVTDPYRWLEDQDSPRTRAWIEEQTRYARAYLDSIPGREHIREHIREFLAVETYDSLQKVGSRYFFRKRLPTKSSPAFACVRVQTARINFCSIPPKGGQASTLRSNHFVFHLTVDCFCMK